MLRPAAAPLALAVLAGIGAAGAAVALMGTSAFLISRAAEHPPVLHLMVAIVCVRAFGLTRGALRYVERLAGHDAAFRLLTSLRVRLFAHLETLAPAGLSAFRRADLLQRLVTDVDAVLDLVTRVLIPYAVALAIGAGTVAVVGSLSPVTGVVLAGGLVAVAVGVPLLQGAQARRADGRLAPLRGELSVATTDLLHGLPDLVSNGAVAVQLDRVALADARLRDAERRSAFATGVSAGVTALTTGLTVLAGLAAGAAAVRDGSLRGELLAVVVLTPLAVYEVVSTLPQGAQKLAAARASLRRIREVLSTPSPVASPAGSSTATFGTIRMEDVSAEWVPGRIAVRDVNLTLSPGEKVALIGPSGSGKSTIAALLLRFLDPSSGRITLDGADLRTLPGDSVRKVIGYLGDDAYLFDTTIAGNLRIGRPAASDEELRTALASARLLAWADTLPAGLDTPVGEHGMALSGGQRRRLALARALLADFPILILDEPTEHLDDETAVALTRDFLTATATASGRTLVVITHRPDVAAMTDRVIDLGAQPAVLAATP
jgi:ATP-binding cassette, subfamily C, bacterial CydC